MALRDQWKWLFCQHRPEDSDSKGNYKYIPEIGIIVTAVYCEFFVYLDLPPELAALQLISACGGINSLFPQSAGFGFSYPAMRSLLTSTHLCVPFWVVEAKSGLSACPVNTPFGDFRGPYLSQKGSQDISTSYAELKKN